MCLSSLFGGGSKGGGLKPLSLEDLSFQVPDQPKPPAQVVSATNPASTRGVRINMPKRVSVLAKRPKAIMGQRRHSSDRGSLQSKINKVGRGPTTPAGDSGSINLPYRKE